MTLRQAASQFLYHLANVSALMILFVTAVTWHEIDYTTSHARVVDYTNAR